MITEEKQNKNKTTTEQQELKEMVSTLHKVFGDLHNNAATSSILLNNKITDSFSDIVSNTINNPIESTFNTLTKVENIMFRLLDSIFQEFLKQNKIYLRAAYRQHNNNNVLFFRMYEKNNLI